MGYGKGKIGRERKKVRRRIARSLVKDFLALDAHHFEITDLNALKSA